MKTLTDTPTIPIHVKTSRKKLSPGIKMFLMIAPFLVLVFIFCYFPLYGWIYAFYDYRPPLKLSQVPFVGFKWFEILFRNPAQIQQMLKVMLNTLAISGLGILTSFIPVTFAIFLTEAKSKTFKHVVQTLTTIPNFISWVMVYSVAFSLFSNSGMVNSVMQSMGLVDMPIKFLDSDNLTWIKMCLWSLWKYTGWNAIMYLAAISGIDQEQYEAARVDGAGRFRLMWHITVPGMMPTFFVLLMLSIANFLNNGLDQYYVFQNAFNREHIQVLDLYVYNTSMGGSNAYSLATVMSMLKSIISVTLLLFANRMSKLVRGETII